MIHFRPTFDDNRGKSRDLALAVHCRHTILCGVIKVTPGITHTHRLHTQPLKNTLTSSKVHVRSLVNLQGVDAVAALHFVLPWLGHRINANIVLVPKREEEQIEIVWDNVVHQSYLTKK